jgi:hypothetical protein
VSLLAAFNLSVDGFDATLRLNLDVTTLEFNHEAVTLITGSLALEAQYGAALRGVPHGAVEDHLALVFRILDGNTADLLDTISVVASPTPSLSGSICIGKVDFRFCDKAYRRLALAAQDGPA